MASLKEYRVRIASVTATRKITRAMQMVASAKLKRAQESVAQARPYADHVKASMMRLLADTGGGQNLSLLGEPHSDSHHLLVVVTAERGLCGGFNNAVIRRARTDIAALLAEGKQVSIITVGRKGKASLERDHKQRLTDHFPAPQNARAASDLAATISARLVDLFTSGGMDRVSLLSSSFVSILVQTPVMRPVLPVQIAPAEDDDKKRSANTDCLCEPSAEAVLAALAPRHVTAAVVLALLENAAGEHSARMTAMDNATRSASDMLRSLELEYNRARQAKITTELIEIISGAEAV